MRATLHNARMGRDGVVFSSRHNDRNFDVSNAEHIDPNKSSGNFYWHCMMPERPEMSFDAVEQEFYKQHFSSHLNAQNQRYTAQRHAERCKTIDDVRKNPRTCPEEVILQIGNVQDNVPARILKNIASKYIAWEQATFPMLKTLDFALHQDEQGGAHIHQRRVWIGHDRDGFEVVSQTKALQEMDIERPNLNMPKSRYNNPKQAFSLICREKFLEICNAYGLDIETVPQEMDIERPNLNMPKSRYNNPKQAFSLICREKFLEICNAYGLDIETVPREKTRSGLHLIDYKAEQAAERAQVFHNMSKKLYLQICEKEREQDKLNTSIRSLKQRESELESKCTELKDALEQAEEFLHRAEIRQAFYILNRERERVR